MGALVGTLVDEETGRPLGLTRPEIALPSAHPDEAETIEIDVAVLATLDVPEEDRLAEAVVWRLSERAGARDGAAAVVEPVSRDMPSWDCVHENPRSRVSDSPTICSWAGNEWMYSNRTLACPRQVLFYLRPYGNAFT